MMYNLFSGLVKTAGFQSAAFASLECQELRVSKAFREKLPTPSVPINIHNSQFTREMSQNEYSCASL
jgi:hypothetical protein